MVGGKQEYCAAAVSLERLNRRVPMNPTRVDARPSVGEARLPPTSDLCTRHEPTKRHPYLLSDHRVTWALRNRNKNDLSACGAVLESRCGKLLVRAPAFLAWFLELAGRTKPRALRKRAECAQPGGWTNGLIVAHLTPCDAEAHFDTPRNTLIY